MKKIIVISLLVIFMFLVSCAPQITDEELEAELAKLTPEEREQLLKDLESKSAFAGQAVAKKYSSSKISSATVQQMKSMLEKMTTRAQCNPPCSEGNFCANLEESCFPFDSCFDSDGGMNLTVKGRTYDVGIASTSDNPGYYSFWNAATGLPTPWPDTPGDKKEVVFRGIDTCVIDATEHNAGNSVGFCSAGGNCFVREFSCKQTDIRVDAFPCVHGCSDGVCKKAEILVTNLNENKGVKP